MNGQNLPLLISCLSCVAVFAIVIGAGREFQARRRSLSTRLQELELQRHYLAASIIVSDTQKQGRVAAVIDQVARDTRFANQIKHELESADVHLTVGEFIVIIALMMAFGALLSAWMQNPALLCLFLLGAYYGPRRWLGQRREKRVRMLDNQLPDMITMLANAMRSNSALPQAIEKVAPQCPAPMSVELGRVVKEMELQIGVREAFAHLLERIPSADFRLLITALTVQMDSGGNIIPMLERISETIRERVTLHAQIKSLTAQQQYAGYVIALLPVGLLGILMVINPNYILNVFQKTTWCGSTMFGVATFMLIMGILVIRRVVDVKV